MHTDPYFIILLCLMPDDFTCQGESAATHWVNWYLITNPITRLYNQGSVIPEGSIAGMDLGGANFHGQRGAIFHDKAKHNRDKIRYSNKFYLSNHMMTSKLWTTIRIQIQYVDGRAAHMTDTTWHQSWQSTPPPPQIILDPSLVYCTFLFCVWTTWKG